MEEEEEEEGGEEEEDGGKKAPEEGVVGAPVVGIAPRRLSFPPPCVLSELILPPPVAVSGESGLPNI